MQLVFVNVADFEIQYAAHTATCTFLLDGDGICRRIVMNPGAPRSRGTAQAAARCVDAQYVASLDASLAGMLAEMPKVGTAMLFARTDESGRISLVRTGHVTRFERHMEDPFEITEDRPSTVATSAPPITPSMVPTPRRQKSILPPPDPYEEGERVDDRTKPVIALREGDLRKLRAVALTSHAPPSEPPTLRTPLPPPPQRMRSDVVPKQEGSGALPLPKPAARRRG